MEKTSKMFHSSEINCIYQFRQTMHNLVSECERNVEYVKLHRMLLECWSSLGKTQKCIRTGFYSQEMYLSLLWHEKGRETRGMSSARAHHKEPSH